MEVSHGSLPWFSHFPKKHNGFPNASNESKLSPAPTTEVDQLAASIGRGHAARGHLDVLRQKIVGFIRKIGIVLWDFFMFFSWVNWYDANNMWYL